MPIDRMILSNNLSLVTEREPFVTPIFFDKLHERHPQTRALFTGNAQRQNKMFHEAIVSVIDHVDDALWLEDTLHELGKRHALYGVTPNMYEWVSDCLIDTFREVSAEQWSDTIEQAWREAFRAISEIMVMGIANQRDAIKQ